MPTLAEEGAPRATQEPPKPLDLVAELMEKVKTNPEAISDKRYLAALAVLEDIDPLRYEHAISDLARSTNYNKTMIRAAVKKCKPTIGQVAAQAETKMSVTQSIVASVLEHPETFELWHTRSDVSYVTIKSKENNSVSHIPLKSEEMKDLITHEAYERGCGVISDNQARSVLNVLHGYAMKGPAYDVYVRVAPCDDSIYLDLNNERGEAVEITAEGWRVVSNLPVRFRRPRGMLALPYPERGGSLDSLRSTINSGSDDQWILIKGWLVGTLNPYGSYPVLVLIGSGGRIKTRTAERLKRVIDPCSVLSRQAPTKDDDLHIAANNNHVLAFDNVSYLSPSMSDKMCRLSSGAGFGKRKFFTDLDEIQLSMKKPVILNGIGDFVVRGDLIDRSIGLYLPVITTFRTDREADEEFERILPKVLGALLDMAVRGLREHGKVQVNTRMADFASWAVACLGSEGERFLDAYDKNKREMLLTTTEGDPLVDVVTLFLVVGDGTTVGEWKGTATDLLSELNALASQAQRRHKYWPQDATRLSSRLSRLEPTLRANGIMFDRVRGDGGVRLIKLAIGPITRVRVARACTT